MSSEKKKILVVEDHPETAELTRLELEHIGYPATSCVANGADALRKAHEERPDLILLDILLPGMNGLEIARRLKADPDTRDIRILAVTGKAMPGDREKCLENGCDGYLAKPFFPRKLKEEIEKLLPDCP